MREREPARKEPGGGESWRRGGAGKSRKTSLRGKGSEEAGGRGVWKEELRRCEDGGEGKQIREKIIWKSRERAGERAEERATIDDRRL